MFKKERKLFNYIELLKDNRWSKKRHIILIRDNNACTNCGSTTCLEVHHLYYVIGSKPWDYPNNSLVTFCSKCHLAWHETHEVEFREVIWGKRKGYKAPLVIDKRSKKIVRKTVKAVVSDKQADKLKLRDKKKRKLIKDNGFKGKIAVGIFKDTKDFTITELRSYLLTLKNK